MVGRQGPQTTWLTNCLWRKFQPSPTAGKDQDTRHYMATGQRDRNKGFRDLLAKTEIHQTRLWLG
jgi:hypothetical protein